METLKEYYINRIENSDNQSIRFNSIINGINDFRKLVVIKLNQQIDENKIIAFDLLDDFLNLEFIVTKEDFIDIAESIYDFIGECNYFDTCVGEGGYRDVILDLWSDSVDLTSPLTISDIKEILSEFYMINASRLDGVIDLILHEELYSYLPSKKEVDKFDSVLFNEKLIGREEMINMLNELN